MPSYFYHLAIELFSRPQSDLNSFTRDPTLTTSLSFESACEALLPFSQKRPSSSSRALRSQPNRKIQRDSTNSSSDTPTSSLPAPYTKSFTSACDFEKDQRLDKVSIQCIDMIPSAPGAARRDPVTTGIGTDILGGLRTKGQYTPLDQKTSESVWGIVHLYRDAHEAPFLGADEYPSDLKGSSAAAARRSYADGATADGYDGVGNSNQAGSQSDKECTTLCVLAVPSYMSASDLLGFVGEATMDDVSHFRMIRTARANRYMVLMRFRSGKKAREWQKEWNGKVFNSMEVCYVILDGLNGN